jgi:hypothetical protein
MGRLVRRSRHEESVVRFYWIPWDLLDFCFGICYLHSGVMIAFEKAWNWWHLHGSSGRFGRNEGWISCIVEERNVTLSSFSHFSPNQSS